MKRQDELNEAWCKYMGKCSTEIMQALAFALRWTDAHPRWISVEDGLPKDGQHVATINKVGVQDVRHYSHGKWYSNFGNEYDDITHWCHLPQPPLVTDLNKKDLPPLSCQEGNILVEEKGGEE